MLNFYHALLVHTRMNIIPIPPKCEILYSYLIAIVLCIKSYDKINIIYVYFQNSGDKYITLKEYVSKQDDD